MRSARALSAVARSSLSGKSSVRRRASNSSGRSATPGAERSQVTCAPLARSAGCDSSGSAASVDEVPGLLQQALGVVAYRLTSPSRGGRLVSRSTRAAAEPRRSVETQRPESAGPHEVLRLLGQGVDSRRPTDAAASENSKARSRFPERS